MPELRQSDENSERCREGSLSELWQQVSSQLTFFARVATMPERKRILFSWIGHADLRGMAASLSQEQQELLCSEINGLGRSSASAMGPIHTLLDLHTFDEIHLLSNYPAWAVDLYVKWIGHKVQVHTLKVDDPSNYRDVFTATNACIADIYTTILLKDAIEFHFFLSPGTPTMAAVFVLLGKSRFPAKFWQTHQGTAREEDIPFDLSVDFLSEILKDSDLAFHHLASRPPQEIEGFENIKGESVAIRQVVDRARRVALRDVSVLLLGESGTGKELFAQAIHNASRRKDKPFIALNCAAFPESLIESELFGHVKGAFTGAGGNKDGAFKLADGGTLFLDEIGECPLVQQAKLLRVLQPPLGTSPCCREFVPVGGQATVRCDVRIIAATNRNLIQEVAAGRFREDLYYRLAAVNVKLPPLRERKGDVLTLAQSFLDKINEDFERLENGYEYKIFSTSTKKFVKSCDWPGNVRQLSNAVLQAAVLSTGAVIQREEIEAAVAESLVSESFPVITLEDGFSLEEYLNSLQRKYIEKAIEEADSLTEAARLLGYKNYQTLAHQMKKFGMR